MHPYIEERVRNHCFFLVQYETTTRMIAEKTGWSRTTVHVDVAERIRKLDPIMAARTRAILNWNKEERSRRGGLAAGQSKNKRKGGDTFDV